ncbi:MAG: MBL fold metallo-hydrolase, partial [Limnobacter sp.]|nr:MBL fold metallo-hydrolase [Limnobacter sp.]
GLEPEQIQAIVVTHEHDDHLGGAFKFSRRFKTPVFLTNGTWRAALKSGRTTEAYLETGLVHLVDSHATFECTGLEVEPFPVPHDAREPIQLLVHAKAGTLGILTDCGSSTPHLIEKLKKAHWLILESNHCTDKLEASPYPDSLKRRVGGLYGHLSNQVACEILREVVPGKLDYVVAAHLSQNTNCPHLVEQLWSGVLQQHGIPFDIACQEEGLAWTEPAKFKRQLKTA